MRAPLRILLALMTITLPAQTGCSLLGLDRLDRQTCGTDADCASLEMVQSTGNACRTWQCEPGAGGRRYCVQGTRDDDNDRVPPAMCVTAPAQADCDDMQMTTAPGAPELCNLVDDNCDGVVDERFVSMPVSLTGAGMAGSASISASPGNEVSVARFVPNSAVLVGTMPAGGSALDVLPTMSARVEGTRGAHVALDEGFLAAFDPVGSDPTCLPPTQSCDGRCSAQEFTDGGVCNSMGPVLEAACTPGCGNGTCEPTENITNCQPDCEPMLAQWIVGPSVQSICLPPANFASASITRSAGNDLLLVWVEDAAPRACGMTRSAPVFARVLRAEGTGAMRRIRAGEQLALGETTDWLGASATFVAGVGFVVAHVNATGAVELHRVELNDNVAMARAMLLGDSGTTAAAEVSITSGGGTDIAISFIEGACASTAADVNRVIVQSAVVTTSGVRWGPALTLQPTPASNHLPVASRNFDRGGEWMVVYTLVDDEYAVRVESNMSATIGAPIASPRSGSASRPYLTPMSASWAFVTATSGETIASGKLECMDAT